MKEVAWETTVESSSVTQQTLGILTGLVEELWERGAGELGQLSIPTAMESSPATQLVLGRRETLFPE